MSAIPDIRHGSVENTLAYAKYFGTAFRQPGLQLAANGDVNNSDEGRIPPAYEALLGLLAHVNNGTLLLKKMPQPWEYTQPVPDVPYRIVSLGTLADGNALTIGDVVFEFDVSGDGVTTGRIDVNGANANAAAPNLKTAINANATVASYGITCRDVVLVGTNDARVILVAAGASTFPSTTITGTTNVTVATAVNPTAKRPLRVSQHSVAFGGGTDQVIVTGFETVLQVQATFLSSAGAVLSTNAPIVVTGGTIRMTAGTTTGAFTALGATDIINLVVLGY